MKFLLIYFDSFTIFAPSSPTPTLLRAVFSVTRQIISGERFKIEAPCILFADVPLRKYRTRSHGVGIDGVSVFLDNFAELKTTTS
jgi:hypothetical protein